jgi:2-dehydropantoate 2-reductase
VRFVIAGAGAIGTSAPDWPRPEPTSSCSRAPAPAGDGRARAAVVSPDGDFEVRPAVTATSTIGTADVVFLGGKAHGLTALAPSLRQLYRPDTVVVSTQNGIPWWYFQGHGGELDGLRLERVDPGGVIAASIEPERVVGSLAYFATDIAEPGVIHHTEGNKLSLGEPNGARSERTKAIADALIAAGLRCPVTTRFRHEIWVKLLGNVAFNPISAVTGGTLEQLVRHAETAALVREIMTEPRRGREARHRAVDLDRPAHGRRREGGRPQDVHAAGLRGRRPMELEAVVGAVAELGNRLGVSMPATRAMYACARFLDDARATQRAPRTEVGVR